MAVPLPPSSPRFFFARGSWGETEGVVAGVDPDAASIDRDSDMVDACVRAFVRVFVGAGAEVDDEYLFRAL